MPFDDKLSQLCLKRFPDWPPQHMVEYQTDHVEFRPTDRDKKWLTYTPQEWLDYKINVPRDGRERVFIHPDVKYKLTKEEFDFTVTRSPGFLCNPVLCPDYFKASTSYLSSEDEVELRYVWLVLQISWVGFGFPRLPGNALLDNSFLFFVFEPLIFNPFIQYWGIPPDDFWIKLSDLLQKNTEHTLLNGFVLYFYSQGSIFPPPELYNEIEDSNPCSLYFAPGFWDE
ncbi:MAG: hypothetical protein ACFFE8_13260 [Candidatus Heimdallarchaeota archaeon]